MHSSICSNVGEEYFLNFLSLKLYSDLVAILNFFFQKSTQIKPKSFIMNDPGKIPVKIALNTTIISDEICFL